MGRPATLMIRVLEDTKKAQRGLAATSKSVNGLGRALLGVAAAAGAIGVVKKMIDAASQMQVAGNAVDTVFKKSAKTIRAWGKQAADSAGLAASEYDQFAALLGAQLKNAGVPLKNLARETDNLIRLGADLATTFGGTTAEAVTALSSLLKHEYDTIERYGVSINQTKVNAELARRGLGKLTGAARVNAERMVIMKLLYQQTADAQGQFAKGSTTAAGAVSRNNAKWKNLAATLGDLFLPLVTRVVNWLALLAQKLQEMGFDEKLKRAIDGVTAALTKLMEFIKAHQKDLLAFAIAIGVVALATGAWALTMAILEAEFTPVLLAILAIAAILAYAWTHSEKFRDGVKALGRMLKEVGEALLELWRETIWPFIRDHLLPLLKKFADDLGAFLKDIEPWVAKAKGPMIDMLKAWFEWLGIVYDKASDLYDLLRLFGNFTVAGAVNNLTKDKSAATTSAPAPAVAAPAAVRVSLDGVELSRAVSRLATQPGALTALTPQSQIIVQVSDRKLADLVEVSIRASATAAARSLTRRAVVIV